ncbi:MAG: hypothetical protein IJX77_10425 [Ruminococcus sp.]|nr:hypothetical protein [Ruminococcus sp.]
MENNKITLSDEERCKELFEYEMTEVVMQLRGEFAKISGKDMNVDVDSIEVGKPDINSEMPEISVEPLKVSADLGSLHKFEPAKLPEITTQQITAGKAAAYIKKIKPVEMNACEAGKISVNCPEVRKAAVPELTSVHIEKIKNVNYSTPNAKVSVTAADIKVGSMNVKLRENKPFKAVSMPEVKAEPSMPKIPSAACRAEIGQKNAELKKFAFPEVSFSPVNGEKLSNTGSVSIERVSCNAEMLRGLHKFAVNAPETVSVGKISAAVPQTSSAKVGYKAASAEPAKITASVPHIGSAPAYTAENISVAKMEACVPGLAQMKIGTELAAEVSPINVGYPSVVRITPREFNYRGVKKETEFNVNVPEVKIGELPSVSVGAFAIKAEVPEIKPVVFRNEAAPAKEKAEVQAPELPDINAMVSSFMESFSI